MQQKFYRKILKNGMVVLFEKRSVPVVSVAFAVRSGGINEKDSEKGISHFIEHMLYKGTPSRNAKQIASEIEKNGGVLNGFTDERVTAYYCKMPSKHLILALKVLSDMIKNPLFDQKEIEKERKVIFEEIEMRKDDPKIYVFDRISSFLYDGSLNMSLIGTKDTMNSLDRGKLLEKFKEVYHPNNMIVAIVGDANFNEIVDFLEKEFERSKGKVLKPKLNRRNQSFIEKRKGIDQANFIFAYHVPTSNDKKSFAADVLNTIVAGGMSSRLFTEIREKRNLAYDVKGGGEINRDFAYNFIYVGAKKENLELVKKLILEEFEKVSKELSEEELKQAKEQLVGNYQISMEDSVNQLSHLLFYELNSNAKDFYDYEKNVRNVNLKDVKDIAKIKNYSFFALVPE